MLGLAAVLAVLLRAFGAVLLTQAWNPYLPVLWWLVFLLAVWAVLCDDLVLLPVAAFAGSFCAQTEVAYLGLGVGLGLIALAVAGVAIAFEPDFIVGPEIRAGRLVPLLHTFESAPANIYVAYPSRRHLSAKVRAFADFLATSFAQPEWLLASAPARTTARGLKPRVRTRMAQALREA